MPRLLATALTTTTWLVASAACHDQLPCPDCDAGDQAADDSDPPSDLPCGGADLMTDDLNCGSCGNVCPVRFAGDEWEAGGCVKGECGPIWTDCVIPAFGDSCDEICTVTGGSCVPRGCNEHTAMLFNVEIDGSCDVTAHGPHGTMAGACDEPIPWQATERYATQTFCCCKYE